MGAHCLIGQRFPDKCVPSHAGKIAGSRARDLPSERGQYQLHLDDGPAICLAEHRLLLTWYNNVDLDTQLRFDVPQ